MPAPCRLVRGMRNESKSSGAAWFSFLGLCWKFLGCWQRPWCWWLWLGSAAWGLHLLSLLKGFHIFETFQAFLITDFKCCPTPKTFNIYNRSCNCQASIDMFLLDMVQTWALAASCMDALLATHCWAWMKKACPRWWFPTFGSNSFL